MRARSSLAAATARTHNGGVGVLLLLVVRLLLSRPAADHVHHCEDSRGNDQCAERQHAAVLQQRHAGGTSFAGGRRCAASTPAPAPPSPSAAASGDGACLLINPDKPFRILWESLGVLVIIWVTLSLPFKIAFLSEQLNDADPLFVFQIFVNIFFIADCALNFYTAYYDENDVLVVDGARIKRNYLRSWFAVDFLGAVPFDYIVLALEGHYYTALEATKLIRILKLMRLFRLLNLHNLFRFFGRFEERLSNTFVKVFKLVVVLILWLHLDACFYFFVARWTQIDTGAFAADSWVALNGLAAAPPAKQYLWSVWVVQSQMLSMAYGPVPPVRTDEVCATMLSMLFGAVLYAGVIGTTASIIAASDQPGTEWYRQWDEVRRRGGARRRNGGAASADRVRHAPPGPPASPSRSSKCTCGRARSRRRCATGCAGTSTRGGAGARCLTRRALSPRCPSRTRARWRCTRARRRCARRRCWRRAARACARRWRRCSRCASSWRARRCARRASPRPRCG